MKKIFKCVLTGSTCVGKTTVIHILRERGYTTVQEFSRTLIEEQQQANSDILPWINPQAFQDLYIERQSKEELQIDSRLRNESIEPVLFMDRCIIDAEAFCVFAGVTISDTLNQHTETLKTHNATYNLIFILEHLESYTLDSGRVINEEESRKIQELIRQAYKRRGYTLVSVPYMSPEERVEFILAKTREALQIAH